MISVEEALKTILDFVTVLDKGKKPILNCLGQVLADDVQSSYDVPPGDNSAMDGYAVIAENIRMASVERPKILHVVGQIPAGAVTNTIVEKETAIRIMTGAVIPQGADVVVPFEETDEDKRKQSSLSNKEIGICKPLQAGSNIRQKGEDIRFGEIVLRQGRLLTPADIGVLASIGNSTVSVVRQPVIGILATGNEVVDLDKPLSPGKIYNSNSYSLAAQVINCGGIPKLLGIAQDDMDQLKSALHKGLDCDMLISSGGVSVGDYDVVKEVLAAEGSISFWTVRMKPGKPLAFGTFTRANGTKIAHLGLPGNPVSSMITFEIFVRPAICKMMGKKDWKRPVVRAVIEDSLRNKDGRRIFARVAVTKRGNEYFCKLTGEQGSGILTSMTRANGLAIIPETTVEVKQGNVLDVMILNCDLGGGI
jgi:molybdopterin molybdotransferase